MSLENLLSNTSCYQSFYPKCFYRRRCWRKVIKHKFDSILSFSRIHSLLNPNLVTKKRRGRGLRSNSIIVRDGDRKDPSSPSSSSSSASPPSDSPLLWKWKWDEVNEIQVISPTVLRFTTIGNHSKSFDIDPCPAQYLEIIFQIHKLLSPARNLVSAHISPATPSGQNRYHCNRIDSSGYISLITDARQDTLDQLKIQDSIEKLRELIEEYTIAMIPNLSLDPQTIVTRDTPDSPPPPPPCPCPCPLPLSPSQPFPLSLYYTHQLLSSREITQDCESHLTKNSKPTLLTIRFPEKMKSFSQKINIPMFVVERMIGYYRLISGYTQHGSLLSQTPLQFSIVPSITHSMTSQQQKISSPYLPNELFTSYDSSELNRETRWTLCEEETNPDNNSGMPSKTPPFYLPSYSIQDCLCHILKLMRVAENSIFCLQKYLFFDPSRAESSGNGSNRSSSSSRSLDKCEVRYQEVLSSYANDCVYKVVSIIRSIVIWNIPESHTNRLGPWNEDFMPFTRYVLKNNLRLMYCLLAVSTTSPFRVDRIPCFSRYIGIRSLVIWEMRARVLSLFDWIKALRNGNLTHLLEVLVSLSPSLSPPLDGNDAVLSLSVCLCLYLCLSKCRRPVVNTITS
jgi:hypothetical protein